MGIRRVAARRRGVGSNIISLGSSGEDWDHAEFSRAIDLDKFLAIEDRELQTYLYSNNSVRTSVQDRYVDDENKIGYFQFSKQVKVNNQGVFYGKSTVQQWLVYDKKTKKGRISNSNHNVFNRFLKDYFDKPDLIKGYITRPTGTLCKRIVEGKIKTLRDLMKYHKSYTLQNTKLSEETVWRFRTMNAQHLLKSIENPGQIVEMCELQDIIEKIPDIFHTAIPFRFKVEDIDKIQENYNDWRCNQAEKYATLLGRGDEKNGNNHGQGTTSQISVVSGTVCTISSISEDR